MNQLHDDVLDTLEESLETISSAVDDILFSLGIQEAVTATEICNRVVIAVAKQISTSLERSNYTGKHFIDIAIKDFIRG